VLQRLHERYGPRGFRVIGFPCNDFANEEPDDLATIQAFCEREYGVTYELMDKVHIRPGRGNAVHPLYEWLTAQLTPQEHALAEAWPPTVTLEVEGLGRTLFCHGTPRSDLEAITAITADERLREILSEVSERTVVCGHTHHQFDRRIDDTRVVNAGSIGMPYEGRPGAYWALLGPDVELRRTEYDLAATAEAIRATSYPDPEEKIELLTSPPSAEEAAEFLEQRALEGVP